MSNNPAYRSRGGGVGPAYTQKPFSYIMPNVSEMSACKYWKNEEGGDGDLKRNWRRKGNRNVVRLAVALPRT